MHATHRTPSAPPELRAINGSVELHQVDVLDAAPVSRLVAELPPIHVLVYVAGIKTANMSDMVEVNAAAPIRFFQAILPRLTGVDRPTPARLLFTTSGAGTPRVVAQKEPGSLIHRYALSKLQANWALQAFEPTLRAAGVTAVALDPGWVKTDLNAGKGMISPETCAKRIFKVLERLTHDHTGEFVNELGRVLDWETGLPVKHGAGERRLKRAVDATPSTLAFPSHGGRHTSRGSSPLRELERVNRGIDV